MPRDTCVKPQDLPAALQLSQKFPPAAGPPIKAVAYPLQGAPAKQCHSERSSVIASVAKRSHPLHHKPSTDAPVFLDSASPIEI